METHFIGGATAVAAVQKRAARRAQKSTAAIPMRRDSTGQILSRAGRDAVAFVHFFTKVSPTVSRYREQAVRGSKWPWKL